MGLEPPFLLSFFGDAFSDSRQQLYFFPPQHYRITLTVKNTGDSIINEKAPVKQTVGLSYKLPFRKATLPLAWAVAFLMFILHPLEDLNDLDGRVDQGRCNLHNAENSIHPMYLSLYFPSESPPLILEVLGCKSGKRPTAYPFWEPGP